MALNNKLLGQLHKVNDSATSLKEDKLSNITDWISTGNYALHGIISADLFKGIPCGRITTLFGPSQSGKSYISAMLQKHAIEKGMTPIIFDSEFDKDGRMEESLGVDTESVGVVPVETIEDVTVEMSKMFKMIHENDEIGKYLFILDSLGALSTRKEMDDVEASKVAQDMGLKAKLIKSFYRIMKGKCSRSKCPLVVINHEIENPNEMHLVGEMNNWNPEDKSFSLIEKNDGTWTNRFNLEAGTEYKIMYDSISWEENKYIGDNGHNFKVSY